MISQDARPRSAWDSLRLRFVLAVSLWVLLGTAAIWLSAARVFEEHVRQSYHEELEVHVRELARLTRIGPDGQLELTRPLSDPRYEEPLSGFYWQVTAHGKRPLLSASMTRGRLDDHVAHSPEITHELEDGPTGPAITYGFVKRGPDGRYIHFVIATDQSELVRLVDRFTRELTIWLAALGALLLATGFAVIGFGLRPLGRLRDAIGLLRAGRAEQLDGRYPSEIVPLVADLNAYVRQNADMIARARVQAGNLAHSLRTPLAIIVDEAERLAKDEGTASSGSALLDQARIMEQQIEYQLARARSVAGVRVPGSLSVLPDLLTPILAAMRRLHADKRFVLDNALPEGTVALQVDPVNMSELVSILLDNAGKWARAEVRLALSMRDGAVSLIVHDDGRGMLPDELARAFEIGTRFDPAMSGSGLGLAIAKDICEAIGSTIELSSPAQGLRAEVRFHAP